MMQEGRQLGHAITAFAAANGLGTDTGQVLEALRAGRSGLVPCSLDVPFETACGALPADLPPLPAALGHSESRLARIALLVLDEIRNAVAKAVRRHGPDRVAMVIGTSTGGILETERAHAEFLRAGRLPTWFDFDRQHMLHGLLEVLRAVTGADGPAHVVSTACSSSGKVFGSAGRLLSAGLADAVLVGGVDTLCQTTLRGFGCLEALSRTPCRPFNATRDGISIGEGGAFALLERDGEGPIRLLGVGESCDAHHMSHPHPEGLGARLAMEAALAQAGLPGSAVDHVNAHGTATPANDVAEARAISAVVGDGVPVASTKGYTGHTLGAAGATEAVVAALCIQHGFVPASLGAEPVDPLVTASIVRAGSSRRVRTVLSNSFAFGGSNVSVLLGAA
jgi:3-oxoacyl-[acyl-carrier-protein] synthase-1